jgi:hypothetical protein
MFNLTTPEFSKKERVLILLKEYDSLREEIIRRTDSRDRFITVAGAVIAATLAFGATRINYENGFQNPNNYVLIGVIAVLILGASIAARALWRPTRRLRQRVVDLEKQIDTLVGGDPLLDRDSSETMRKRMKLRLMEDPNRPPPVSKSLTTDKRNHRSIASYLFSVAGASTASTHKGYDPVAVTCPDMCISKLKEMHMDRLWICKHCDGAIIRS